MTIVEKVINLLENKQTLSLKEIYAELKNHTPATIRGNINRYLLKTQNPKIKRINKGIYSIIEILSVEEIDDENKKVSYMNKCMYNNKTVAFFHKDFVTNENIKIGTFENKQYYESYESLINDYKSLYSTIIEGDSRDVLKRFKDNSIDCIITDPAYKCISGGTSDKKGTPSGILSKNDGKIFKHNNIEFEEWLPDAYRILKEGSHAYIFTNFLNLNKLMTVAEKVGFSFHNLLVWQKNNATPNRWYMKNAEYILFCRKGKAKAINNKGSKTVEFFENLIGNKIHETEKPLELIEHYLLNSTKENDILLDPFGGSCVLNIAGLKNNRRTYSIEIDKSYIKKGINRIRNFLKYGQDRLITD